MKTFLMAAAAAAALFSAPAAHAADFSFAGTLTNPSQVLFFDFTVGSASLVTLRTYSYAGGTNAQGAVIARGGFDPMLGLYDVSTGLLINSNDDGGSFVPADSVTGARYDTYLQATLASGTYRAAVSVYPNQFPTNLNTGTFPGATTFNGRTANLAFDVLNVGAATGPGAGAVPEPATWAMMIAGFGLVGGTMRRRSTKIALRLRRDPLRLSNEPSIERSAALLRRVGCPLSITTISMMTARPRKVIDRRSVPTGT